MKKIALAAIFAAAFVSPSMAADMPTKAPTAAAVVQNWTGFYIGINGGAAVGTTRQTDSLPFDSGRYGISGPMVGVTAGYNWQSGPWVFGVEGDYDWSRINGTTTGFVNACGGAPSNCNLNIQSLATVRGRIGYTWGDAMAYVTGGAAFADEHGSEGTVVGAGAVGSGSRWVTGWTAGAGAEVKFTPAWSAKFEYLYVDLGNQGVFTDNLGGGVFVTEFEQARLHLWRAGVNYRF